jgi:hypothetical protein
MIAITSGFAGEKQKYHFMVFSNAANGKEDTYLKWYEGQHIHDLSAIPGFVAAQLTRRTHGRITAPAWCYRSGP